MSKWNAGTAWYRWLMPCVFGLLGFLPITAQNIIVNGTFDTFVPSNGTGGGWSSSTIAAGGWFAAGGNPTAMFTLNDSGQNTNPRIEQTLSGLTIGESYTVTGNYRIHVALGNPANSFGVLIDTNVILQLGSPGNVWTGFSTSFTATSNSHVFAIEAERNGSDHSYSIDNISVFAAAIPEPTTWALIGISASAASAVAFKYRKRLAKRRKWETAKA